MEIERTKIKDEIAIEESQQIKLTVGQVKFFLLQLRRGDINDIKYRKALINGLVNKVYLYEDNVMIVFNTQDKPIDKKVPEVETLDSSFMGKSALPLIITRLKFSFFYRKE